ncbi:MAG: hypothetical protein HON98_10920 [Chloroflexi bacterium]|nr:hypothetical protein [Chloroflexota bacterium]MBT3668624.1 hypothetical protein [Chloroflexota bacterium]MBT4002367.1 hypothetical protein [Chloroflexota bacterium]MBT4306231.1 hypothetical protein [Chloroflexota bacterium]MBT4532888.1 hypothetical protein [Chloroflexota bacterium]
MAKQIPAFAGMTRVRAGFKWISGFFFFYSVGALANDQTVGLENRGL